MFTVYTICTQPVLKRESYPSLEISLVFPTRASQGSYTKSYPPVYLHVCQIRALHQTHLLYGQFYIQGQIANISHGYIGPVHQT
jgi:hypothetical protein